MIRIRSLLIAALLSALVGPSHSAAPPVTATCSGTIQCTACKNCSKCKRCHLQGGSCGVCASAAH
jgi:hypothetical protein